ncbi:MAG: soluble lytic murein transglycosylase-like protein, partial [Myxococcota bacterium]
SSPAFMIRRTAAVATVAMLTALGALTTEAAAADRWSELRAAVDTVRTLEPGASTPAVLKSLKRLTKRGTRTGRAAAAHVLARVHAAAGRPVEARAALKAAGTIKRVSAPAWEWARVEVLIAEGRERDALLALGELRRRFPKFRWAAAALMYSRLQETAAQPMAAAQTALQLLGKSSVRLPGDELLDRAARIMDGPAPSRAAKLWRRLVLEYPHSPISERAMRRIEPLTAAEKAQRVDRLFAVRAYDACRHEALQLWQAGMSREVVGYYLGKIASERLRDDYPGAEQYLAAASVEGAPFALQALSSLAIVRSKLGKVDASVRTFDQWLTRFASAPIGRRAEAWYDRGRALHVAGRSLEAATAMAGFLKDNRRGFKVEKYQWFVGWWRFLGKDYPGAIAAMKPLLKKRDTLVGAKARYWIARARWEAGKRKAAIDGFATLARDLPLTYYGTLAMGQLKSHGKKKRLPRLRRIPRAVRVRPFADLKPTSAVTRVRAAVHLGEPDVARRVWKVTRKHLVRELGAERTERLEVDLADELGLVAEQSGAIRRQQKATLRRVPTKRTVGVWRQAYPRAFRVLAAAAAKRNGVPEPMVYAHMMVESRFRDSAISKAPAFGLLQLLDSTSRRLAADRKATYQLWMLLEPRHNISLGVAYLGKLVKKFHGQLPFAIGAYNGGPRLYERLLKLGGKLPFDAMVEDIATHESRNYMRRVTETAIRYAALYSSRSERRALVRRLVPGKWHARHLNHPNY